MRCPKRGNGGWQKEFRNGLSWRLALLLTDLVRCRLKAQLHWHLEPDWRRGSRETGQRRTVVDNVEGLLTLAVSSPSPPGLHPVIRTEMNGNRRRRRRGQSLRRGDLQVADWDSPFSPWIWSLKARAACSAVVLALNDWEDIWKGQEVRERENWADERNIGRCLDGKNDVESILSSKFKTLSSNWSCWEAVRGSLQILLI